MKNLIFVGASVLLCANAQIDGGECTYAVELLQLQDGSASFQAHIENMTSFMLDLVDTLHERYGEFKYGVSSFVDKPIPYSGFGNFGDWGDWVDDYCYRHHAPLAEDAITVVKGLNELVSNLGAGNDFPENPLEALMYAAADPQAQWSPVDQTHSEGGRPIVRIAMVITDDIPHVPIDAYSNTQLGWNWPRAYPNGPEGESSGGFGAHSFATSVQVNLQGQNGALYYEMADLFRIFDNEGLLSGEQEARLDELITKFGPYPWPMIETVHPGDLSLDCAEVEYPTAEQVGDFLRPHNVLPIFLVAKPQAVARPLENACNQLGYNPHTETTACLVEYYKQNATRMNLPAVVAAIDGENTLEVIVDAVGALTDLLCLMPTTTTTTTTTTISTTELIRTTEMVTTLPRTPLSSTTEAPSSTEAKVGTQISSETVEEEEGKSEDEVSTQPDGGEISTEDNPLSSEDISLGASSEEDGQDTSTESVPAHPTPTEDEISVTGEPDANSSTGGEEGESSTPPTVDAVMTTVEFSEAGVSSEEANKSGEVTSSASILLSATSSEVERTEEATTEDEIVIVVPPINPPTSGGGDEGKEGPNVGVIAGATGGAVAGVAALAGLAYANFGTGMFGGGAPAGMEGIQQVEVPDSPIERETMEEVTMDMFQ